MPYLMLILGNEKDAKNIKDMRLEFDSGHNNKQAK